MFVLLNHKRIDINNSESITIREAIGLLELSICRQLQRPLVVAVNEKIVTGKTWKLMKIGKPDILEISESASDFAASNPEHVINANTHTKQDMTRSAFMRKSLLNEDVLSEYRRRIKK